jgi:hypothetical protein
MFAAVNLGVFLHLSHLCCPSSSLGRFVAVSHHRNRPILVFPEVKTFARDQGS